MKDQSPYIDRKYDMTIWQLDYCGWIPFWHFFLWKKRPRTTGPYRVCIKHFKRRGEDTLTQEGSHQDGWYNSNLAKTQERHLRRTIISYNAVISACSGHWQVALSLLRDIEGWVCTEWYNPQNLKLKMDTKICVGAISSVSTFPWPWNPWLSWVECINFLFGSPSISYDTSSVDSPSVSMSRDGFSF